MNNGIGSSTLCTLSTRVVIIPFCIDLMFLFSCFYLYNIFSCLKKKDQFLVVNFLVNLFTFDFSCIVYKNLSL
jgi:hypothetical protein